MGERCSLIGIISSTRRRQFRFLIFSLVALIEIFQVRKEYKFGITTSYSRIDHTAPIPHTLNDKSTFTSELTTDQNAAISYTHDPSSSKIVSVEEELPMLNDKNTIIAMISMGNARKTLVAETCVRSIRKSGNFAGHIMILTDPEGSIKYNDTLSYDPNTIVLEGTDEDMWPKSRNPPEPMKFAQSVMIYKRYKTLLFDYVDYSPELANSTEYIVYIDVDTIVTNDVSGMFLDYHGFVTNAYANRNRSDVSFFSAFRQSKSHMIHSGFMVFSRKHSKGCLRAWREMIETEFRTDSDQKLLGAVVDKHYDQYYCRVYELQHSRPMESHFDFVGPPMFQQWSFPTLVHITNTRLKRVSNANYEKFIRYALALQPNETLVGTTTWEDLIHPPHWSNDNLAQGENFETASKPICTSCDHP